MNLGEIGLESFRTLNGAENVKKVKGGFAFTSELKPLSASLVKVNVGT